MALMMIYMKIEKLIGNHFTKPDHRNTYCFITPNGKQATFFITLIILVTFTKIL